MLLVCFIEQVMHAQQNVSHRENHDYVFLLNQTLRRECPGNTWIDFQHCVEINRLLPSFC